MAWIIENLDPGDSFTITYETLTDSDILTDLGILFKTYVNVASVLEEEADSTVEVREPRVLALSTETKEVKGKVLGAETETGSPVLAVLAISFILSLTFYFIYCIRERTKKAKISLKEVLK